jgi:hypothetical protein
MNDQIPEATPPVPAPPNAQERLQRLKKVVTHLDHTWSDVLQRQRTMQALGQREDLHKVLEHTGTVNITNMLQHVLVMDLLREIGALILDPDMGSASALRALSALRDPELMRELRAEHEVVRPVTTIRTSNNVPDHVWAQWDEERKVRDRQDQIERFDSMVREMTELEPSVRSSDTAQRLTRIRNKGVAHYDVVPDGAGGWKLWAEGGSAEDGSAITWGEINDYIDSCTRVIELLNGAVCHTSYDFAEAKKVHEENVDEFIGVLTAGLTAQKAQREKERAEERERRRAEYGI